MEPNINQQVIELLRKLIDRLQSGETVVENYELENLLARRMPMGMAAPFYENVPKGQIKLTLHLYSQKADRRDGTEFVE